MSNTLMVDLVSADQQIWAGPAKQISLKSTEGEIGILPGHEPVLAVLADDGIVRIEAAGGGEGQVKVKVSGGFFSVDSDQVRILADEAMLES